MKRHQTILIDIENQKGDYLLDVENFLKLKSKFFNRNFSSIELLSNEEPQPIDGKNLDMLLNFFREQEWFSLYSKDDSPDLVWQKNIHDTDNHSIVFSPAPKKNTHEINNHSLTLDSADHKLNITLFFKRIIQELKHLNTMEAHDAEHCFKLASRIYKLFRRLKPDVGLMWLNYYNAAETKKRGGRALFDLPYATHIEEINGGIFIQIGESPEEAMTPEGEERLFKATEWVHQLIQSQGN
jgi:hypothetical protein